MTKKIIFYLSLGLLAGIISSCDKCSNLVKKGVNKTGEAVGSTAAEAGKGIYEGAKGEFESKVVLSEALKKSGLSVGKIDKASMSGNFNILHLYLITEQDYKDTVIVKVLDKYNKEYGRTKLGIKRKKGEAGWVDFIFDPRTDFENNSTFEMQ